MANVLHVLRTRKLKPPCVKLDNAFFRGINDDLLKRSFLDAVQQLAVCAGAPGGRHIARPSATPPLCVDVHAHGPGNSSY
jgi:hypothetical protein